MAAVVLAAAGCGTPGSSAGGEADGTAESQAAMQEVYDAVDGLGETERRQKLIELAKEEGGAVNIYHAGDLTALIEKFEGDTGLEVEEYHATSEEVSQRATAEHQAGHAAADLIIGSAADLRIMHSTGVTMPFESPTLEKVDEQVKGDGWISPFSNVMLVAWNTNKVDPAETPRSWEDVFERFGSRMNLEKTDEYWFHALISSYFVERKGMTQQEAIDFVKAKVKGAQVVHGHSLAGQLLISGQYDLAPTYWHHNVPGFLDIPENAPVAWEPPVEPIFWTPLGMGIPSTTQRPAAALLLLEYVMTDGQQIFNDEGRAATNPEAVTNPSINLDDYDNVRQELAVAGTPEEVEEWTNLYGEVLRAAGTKTIEE